MARAILHGWRLGAAATLLLVAVALFPGSARGDGIADKRAQAAAIASKIDQLNTTVESYGERANGAQIELDGLNQQAAEAEAKVAGAQAQMDQHRGELKDYAVNAYVRGGADDNANATANDAQQLGLAQGYLVAATGNRQQLVDGLNSAEEDLQVQLKALDGARASAEAKTAQLNDAKANAQSAVDQQRALYSQAQGELATLLAQEQQRMAQEQVAAAAQRARQASAAAQAPQGALATAGLAATSAGRAGVVDPGPAPSPNGNVSAVIARAEAQLGKPYVWGATGPNSFDCSGLTMYAWQAAGVSLPHYTESQYAATRHISLSQLQPGDLVFYHGFGHEGMYIGDGQIIEAPHSGANVQIVSLYYPGQPEVASRPG
ncbi:MAG: NlpC/P60 family protein [Acidimicrobiales bacterium]